MQIETLFVLAGPRAAGKTTFMTNCHALIQYEHQPPVLYPFFAQSPPMLHLMELASIRGQQFTELRLHVDIFTPFQDLPPCSEADLISQLALDRFRQHHLIEHISHAKTVYVLTLRVPRQVVLRRWLARVVQNNSDLCRTNLAHIYSDATGDKLYNCLYNAWDDFVGTLDAAGIWDVVEDEGKYTLMTQEN